MKQMVKAIAVIIVMVMVIPALGMASDATEVSASGNWSDQDNADITWHTGSQSHTYTLSTAGQLAGLAELVNGGNTFDDVTIELVPGKTYDLSAHQWTPIGEGFRDDETFKDGSYTFNGTFDGNGATINGLTITNENLDKTYAVGFFGIVSGGTVKDITFTHVNINVPSSELAGTVVGLAVNNSTISGCTVGSESESDKSTVTAIRGNGGIVGRMTISGTIKDCTNYADINASGANSGGIVGAAYYTRTDSKMTIAGCVNYGDVKSDITTSSVAGGIVGLSSANVSGCTNYAIVTGTGYSIGGIIGEQQNYGSVTKNVNYGLISNTSEDENSYGTGGIIGWIRYSGSPTDYTMKGVISVKYNINTAIIYGGNDAGGIVGTVYFLAEVTGNINTAPVLEAKTFAAGIVGNAQFNVEDRDNMQGLPDRDMVTVSDNVSTTPIITGSCQSPYVYDNSIGAHVTLSNNSNIYSGNLEMPAGNNTVDLESTIESMGSGSSLTVSGTGDTVSLTADSISESAGKVNLIINVTTPSGASSITFSSSVLQSICEQLDAETEVSLTIAPTAEVTNPFVPSGSVGYNIYLCAGETQISNLGGSVEVTLPFEPADGYSVNDYQIWYVDGDNVERYALNVEEDGYVSFSTTHFSEWYFVLDQPVYPDYGDDDESLPPFIPQQSSGNDDATLYIACCAAAAVVALLAIVMVMMERRK